MLKHNNDLKPHQYNDDELISSLNNCIETWKRLYPDGRKDVPIYEHVEYLTYLASRRGLLNE